MAKYAKPPRRTELRGLRPYSGSTGAESFFSAKAIQKMGERVEGILANSSLHSEDEKFILEQIRLVCLFRQARDLRIRDRLLREINRGERMGQGLGFDQEDLRSLNRWVLDQDLGGKLETLLEKVERKRA